MPTQVSNEDGTEADLIEHLSHVHQKGTKGFTDEYLKGLHKTLHQPKRDPLPEHTHPEDEASEPETPDKRLPKPEIPERRIPQPETR